MTRLRRLVRALIIHFALLPRRTMRALMEQALIDNGAVVTPGLRAWVRQCERAARQGRPLPDCPESVFDMEIAS